MRKKFFLIVCSAMLCASIIGCSKSKEEGNSVVENETETEAETETINYVFPFLNRTDLSYLQSASSTQAVSLKKGDVYVDDTGALQMDVTVYTYDCYDMVDMASLEVGDIIEIRGNDIKVVSLERNEEGLFITTGLGDKAYKFMTTGGTVWFECGHNDLKYYYEVGETTFRVSADMKFYDSSDPDKGEVVYYPGDFLTDDAGIEYHFEPNNTSIVIEDGVVIAMYRSYLP